MFVVAFMCLGEWVTSMAWVRILDASHVAGWLCVSCVGECELCVSRFLG